MGQVSGEPMPGAWVYVYTGQLIISLHVISEALRGKMDLKVDRKRAT
jgi:hypothetical protein